MKPETQKELLESARKALKIISVAGKNAGKNKDFVFELRDIIRKADLEEKNESN